MDQSQNVVDDEDEERGTSLMMRIPKKRRGSVDVVERGLTSADATVTIVTSGVEAIKRSVELGIQAIVKGIDADQERKAGTARTDGDDNLA